MKKRIINIFLVLLFAAGFHSCYDDLLEPVPETVISELSVFDTKERIEAQIKGVYAAFKSGQYLGGRYQVYNSIRGDLFLNLQSNGVTAYNTWNHNLDPSASEVQNLWGAIYAAVNRVNMFIEGMEKNTDKIFGENILTQELYDEFVGEAYALRGMAFHHIIQLYSRPYNENPQNLGAILRVTAQRSSADNDMARVTLAETYEQIIQDLNMADSLLPVVSGPNNAYRVTRINRSSVAAFKTRIYLQMSDYENVIAAAENIVTAAAPFTAEPDSAVAYSLHDNFEEIFTNWTTSESIFSIPMTTTELPGTQNFLAHYFSNPPVGGQEYPINLDSPTWISNEFPDDDARRLLVQERTIQQVVYKFLDKYQQSPPLDWAPVIRYAEVLLNLAEAEVRQGGSVTPRAMALLNAVFLRSNPNANALDITNVDDFLDRLMLEREMEFLGEGINNMDIMRTLSNFRPKANVGSVGPGSTQYVWPIPQSELNTNQLVQPNH